MTINSTIRKAGPFIGNGTASVFPFAFKVFQASDVEVVRLTVATNVETVLALTTDYTVSLNQDQDSNPGGSITLVAGALASGYNLVITSDVLNLQPTDLTNQGGFYPDVINDALDRATIQIQQLQTSVDRAALLPITSSADAASLVADIVRLADSADNLDIDANNIGSINTVATNIANVNTTASNIASVNTAASSITNINTTAANITNVNAVGSDLLEPVSEINTVATSIVNVDAVGANIANVNTVAGNNANITTVAGISGNVTTVATNNANVTTAATNINAINIVANDLNEPVSEIDTVATHIANVDTVGANITNVNTVAGVSGNVTTVAGISANVTTVATNNANVTTVATNITNVNTVAGSNTAVNTVATNIAAVNSAYTNLAAIIDAPNQAAAAANSAAQAAASAASGMYSAVQDKSANYTIVAADAGDLIRVTTTSGAVTITLPLIGSTGITDGFKIAIVKWTADANAVNIARSGSDTINGATSAQIGSQYSQIILVADAETNTWFASQSGLGATNINVDTFSGNGSTTAFTLTSDPSTKNNTSVFISGVYQQKSTYSLSGTTLTFSTAPPSGTSNIEVAYSTPLAIGTPSDGTVSTAKLEDGAVTYAKIQQVTAGKVLGRDTSGAGAVQELPIAVTSGGNVGIGTSSPVTPLHVYKNSAGATLAIFENPSSGMNSAIFKSGATGGNWSSAVVFRNSSDTDLASVRVTADSKLQFFTGTTEQSSIDSSGNFKFNSGYGSVATAYGCRAWVNFNGTGTVAIRASGNVSSITDNGTGNYTVNFTTAMPDANYSVSWNVGTSTRTLIDDNGSRIYLDSGVATASSVRVFNTLPSGTADTTTNGNGQDMDLNYVSIFR